MDERMTEEMLALPTFFLLRLLTFTQKRHETMIPSVDLYIRHPPTVDRVWNATMQADDKPHNWFVFGSGTWSNNRSSFHTDPPGSG